MKDFYQGQPFTYQSALWVVDAVYPDHALLRCVEDPSKRRQTVFETDNTEGYKEVDKNKLQEKISTRQAEIDAAHTRIMESQLILDTLRDIHSLLPDHTNQTTNESA